MQSQSSVRLATPLRGSYALALYELAAIGGTFVATNRPSVPFDEMAYSEFKYGKRSVADLFGGLLAEQLILQFAGRVESGEEIVVLGTPYKNLPNAARLLAISTERRLRAAGFRSSYSRIYQDHVGEGVYANFTQAERDARNDRKNRFFDPRRLEGRHIVVVDDVRVTGSVQRSIVKLLDAVPKLSLTIANLAQLDPVTAQREPQLEYRLNHLAVKHLKDVLRLMKDQQDFVLVTRTVRYILQSTPADILNLLEQLDAVQVTLLYEAVIEERYDQLPDYAATAQIVIDHRNQKL